MRKILVLVLFAVSLSACINATKSTRPNQPTKQHVDRDPIDRLR